MIDADHGTKPQLWRRSFVHVPATIGSNFYCFEWGETVMVKDKTFATKRVHPIPAPGPRSRG